MQERSNTEWLTALKGDGVAQASALVDLRGLLMRAARYALSRNRTTLAHLAPSDIEHLAEDCTQEALSALLEHLGSFRGDSRFTTWAYKFAVNAALVAARRERWRRIPLDRLLENPDLADSPDPLKRALRHEALAAIHDGIEQQLSVRQRQVLIAVVFDEVPLDELVRHWGSNRNALYKLLHDARKKLKAHLRDRGLDTTDLLAIFATGPHDSPSASRRSE
jgi:RNA polymerase sigma-70 factor (ECF subfamily)